MLDSAYSGAPVLNVAASLTGRTWLWRTGCDRTAFALAQRQELPDIVARILAARDITIDTAADFLSPTLRALLPDPATLADMEPAATRLAHAVQTGETVAIFGDYDVDGACSTALLTTFLRALGCPVLPYIPDRLTEGYGPNPTALRHLAGQGASLILCADCGTSAHTALEALHGQADIIILDHHKAETLPPPVLATVNPNRLDCGSGLHALCAAGVAFMAAIATLRALRRAGHFAARPEPDLMALLDLVALATICDVMPLTGLNRAFVAQGLRVMAKRARPGLAALLDVAQAKEAPNAATCGYALGPRINAGGRISESDLGLRLLLSDDPLDARLLAERLDAVNRQRQTVESTVLQAAIEAADAQMQAGHSVLFVHGEKWHPGIVGIVAGRLKEKFNRPTCVGGTSDGLIKGSGRSTPGHDLGAAIIAARQSGILATGGGHAMAAGFSLPPDRAADFHTFLNARLPTNPTAPTRPHLHVEAIVSPGGANLDLATHLARLAPFGTANEEPMLVLADIRVVRTDRLGNDGNTIRAFVQSEGDPRRLKTLLFRAGDTPLGEALSARVPLHLAGHLRAESWNGTTTASFMVVDGARV
jgi:single-stranded-DNA-specific exonuclease